jgi:hypothetical protein
LRLGQGRMLVGTIVKWHMFKTGPLRPAALRTLRFSSTHTSKTQMSKMSQSTRAPKLQGRAFSESIGSPKLILAPMVEQSEFVRRAYAALCSKMQR